MTSGALKNAGKHVRSNQTLYKNYAEASDT